MSNVIAIHDRFYITPAGHLYYHVGNQCTPQSSLDSNLLVTKDFLYPSKQQTYLRRGVQSIAVGKEGGHVTNAMILDFKGDVYTIGCTLNGMGKPPNPRKLVSDVRVSGSSVLALVFIM